jgi:HEAT repeat protein
MTIERKWARSGRSVAPRTALALAAVVAAFVVATGACAVEVSAGEFTQRPAADDSASAHAVLTAVRGESPLACGITARALENRWGSQRRLGGPDAAVLDDADAAAFDWAMSGRTVAAVLPELRRAMSDPDACVRRTAAQLVGRVDSKQLVEQLRAELAGNATMREVAVLALGYAGGAAAAPALAGAASDAEPRVRRTAAWALGRSNSQDAVRPLVSMLRDADPIVRVNAALSLGELSAAAAVDPLSELLASDRDARVRRAAAAALGQIDDSRSKP